MNRLGLAACVVLALGLGGCGKELTAGGYREGEVETFVADEQGAFPAVQFSRLSTGPALSSVAASGTLSVRLAAWLVDAAGTATPLTNDTVRTDLQLASSQAVRVGLESVEAKRYTAVRLAIASLEAQVQGLTVGGLQFTGVVEVDTGAGPISIDVPVELLVEEDVRSRVTIELNSASWLATAQLVPGTIPPRARVSAEAVRTAIGVTAE